MAEQTTVLQLVLNQLEMGNTISSMDDRIAIQKVVCLAQEAGLQLGYSFNWYIRGPYSPSLASDYYQIAGSKRAVEVDAGQYRLSDAASSALQKVSKVLSVPRDVPLTKVQWLELLASMAFLMKRYKLSEDATKSKIQQSKPKLYPYFDDAVAVLARAGFGLE